MKGKRVGYMYSKLGERGRNIQKGKVERGFVLFCEEEKKGIRMMRREEKKKERKRKAKGGGKERGI